MIHYKVHIFSEYSLMMLICILVVKIYTFLIFWYKHSNRIPKHISVHLCVMLAFVKRVFVGEGRAVLTIDEAGSGPSEALVPFCVCQ